MVEFSATRSASKEGSETAVALPRSRQYTKEPVFALPSIESMGKFGARAELRNVLQESIEVEVLPVVDLMADSAKQGFLVGNATQVY